jgi:DNA invertase Pin-like site-specific DNA recombinase
MTKRAIQLIRVSTAGQADQDRASIPSQKTINERTAKAHGLTIVKTIQIADVSGVAVLLAPEIQELIVLMRDPEIHGVVAREFSRLMRPENFTDYAFLQAFSETGTILYLPEGPIDFSSKTGRLMGTIRAAIAGMERTEILERIWNAKEEKRRNGGFAQSRICLPFGVSFIGGSWRYTDDVGRVQLAFQLALSGDASYTSIGNKVGIRPYNLRNILRNPIYTGWRVIDKKRDLSAAGKYKTKDGRQGDRRKIQRAPDEVIRVKVIDDPLISESDFQKVQRILDLKKQNSWRHIEGYEHRFTYNGYLNCECGALVYTKYRRDDYYVCKVRCGASYMRRDRLEPMLDKLFTRDLTRPRFLQKIVKAMKQKEPTGNQERYAEQLKGLEAKRQRVLSAFYDGVIDVQERESKLAEIATSRRVLIGMAERERPVPQVTVEALAEVFAPFMEFDLLGRNDKRRLLNTITPSITAANYRVSGLWMASGVVPDMNLMEMACFRPEGLQGRLWLKLDLAA